MDLDDTNDNRILTHLLVRELALILKKVDLASVATAFASNVFPFPIIV